MKTLVAVLALLPAVAAAEPRVEVKFGDLDKFTDLRVSITTTRRDREGLAAELRSHIEREAPHYLPPATRLDVTITDVDMAGEYGPITGPVSRDLRVVRDVYPPCVDLDFRLLRADGSVERSGRRELRDSGFLLGSSPHTDQLLRHEKGLLDGWLQKEFKPAR